MKKLERYIIRDWFWIAIGCVFTKKAVEFAYLERGYKAVGGELLVFPMLLIVVEVSREIFSYIIKLIGTEDKEDDT